MNKFTWELAILGMLVPVGGAWADSSPLVSASETQIDFPASSHVIGSAALPPAAEWITANDLILSPVDIWSSVAFETAPGSESLANFAVLPVSPTRSAQVVTVAAGLAVPISELDAPQPESLWAWDETSQNLITAFDLAQATDVPADDSPWRVEFRPYLQVPFAINGRLRFDSSGDGGGGSGGGGGGGGGGGTGGSSLNVDLGLGLDLSSIFLAGGELEVWYNDFGLLLDGFYASLGTRVLAGISTDPNTGAVLEETSVELGADYIRVGAALGWRAGRFPLVSYEDVLPDDTFPAVTVDLFGGAKYSSYGFDATTVDRGQLFRLNPNWIEPGFLARTEFLIDSRTKLIANGYIGGFGIGNAPSLSWSGYIGLDWRFLPNVSIRPSYQIYDTTWNGDLGSLSLQTQAIWLGFSVYFD